MSKVTFVMRGDVVGAVELTSWSSELVKAVVAASVDHLQPGYDAVERTEALIWAHELGEVVVDSEGMAQFIRHLRLLSFVDATAETLQ